MLNEISEASGLTIEIEEKAVPVRDDVQAACEILGLDPFQVACEGRFALFVPAPEADRALEVMRQFSVAENACRIGSVASAPGRKVVLKSRIGARRIPGYESSGEQLPRIC